MLAVPYAYWIVCPRAKTDLPHVATFREWLLEQAGADAAELSVIFGRPLSQVRRRRKATL
jgi:hypothetical protein